MIIKEKGIAMSYDLVVFEKSIAPASKAEFLDWYEEQVEWKEDHDYDSIEVSSSKLKSWFLDMIKLFPPMNGNFDMDVALENDQELENRFTDYSIGKNLIYAGSAWSQAETAYNTMLMLALKHDVGFFDVSGTGAIILSETIKLD